MSDALRPTLNAHYNAPRLRSDTWTELKSLAIRLAEGGLGEAALRGCCQELREALDILEPIESYFAFPGRAAFAYLRSRFERREYERLAALTVRVHRALIGYGYRRREIPLLPGEDWDEGAEQLELSESLRTGGNEERPYFEVMVVDHLNEAEENALRVGLREMRRPEDRFRYGVVVVPSFEDAVIAALFNVSIQAVVVRYGFPFRSKRRLEVLEEYLGGIDEQSVLAQSVEMRGPLLGRVLKALRAELDLYLVSDVSVEELAGGISEIFRRVFYRQEDYLELHLSILRGIESRYRTPFFSALREYAEQPTGVFHAMPISRGKSVVKSHWIRDMLDFYGLNIFLAETSSTSGGLDSLLDPKGSLKDAQSAAARAFGARRTFFVTNGTSTANKIVVQGLLQPGDIILIDRDCHKSHHYTLVLSGARVHYLDSYPLHSFSFYGAVPLSRIVGALEEHREAGTLDSVRAVLLTNCTFDGIVYNPEQVMAACLAIKPDLVFIWDEAWFAFARFSPLYRRRTAMESAQRLRDRYRSPEYRAAYDAASDAERATMADPDRVRVRVYATQSTHKTLTSLRQGSMIHVFDQDWGAAQHAFHEAFMTHTSTSPNYQILASLDAGRRQVELEGYELVQKQIELALVLREKAYENPEIRRWFRFLTIRDLVPADHRVSGVESYYDSDRGWSPMAKSWAEDEFVLDPTRLTLFVGQSGIDGDTFKRDHLMARHGIQVNKTSRNTVLFMTNIGTTRSSVAHLIEVLTRLAHRFEDEVEDAGPAERRGFEDRVRNLTENLPPLPDFSRFHHAFRSAPDATTPEGDLRRAYFLAADEENVEYLKVGAPMRRALADGREVVAAAFITPYPPGFPILVPGQVVSNEILGYLRALDTKEIHGYRSDLGIRVFTEAALAKAEGMAS
ncbi:MAG: ornithine decarboxylase [Planctomycetes bacterium]|nr:ornithine decarboxylase [Planctomycetota bacterium]